MNIPVIKSYQERAIDTVVSVINAAKEKLGMRQTLKQLASEYNLTVCALQNSLDKHLCCVSTDSKNTDNIFDPSQTEPEWNPFPGYAPPSFLPVMATTCTLHDLNQAINDRAIQLQRGDGICAQTCSPESWVPHHPTMKNFGCMTSLKPVANILAQARGMTLTYKLSLKPIKPPYAISSEKFINDTIEKDWDLGDTFKYFVRYMGGSRDEMSQYYYFEAIFSQPTVSYPIPQATASVFFTLEDKHIDPPEIRGVPKMWFRIEGQHSEHDMRYVALQADWLLALIQMKMKLFERIESIRMF